jgi:hypothetical protein
MSKFLNLFVLLALALGLMVPVTPVAAAPIPPSIDLGKVYATGTIGPSCPIPAPGLCVGLSADKTSLILGESTTLSVQGQDAVAYRFIVDGQTVQEGASSTYTYTPTSAGTHHVAAQVQGKDGNWSGSSSCTVTIKVGTPVSGYVCEARSWPEGDPIGVAEEKTTLFDGTILTGPESESITSTARFSKDGQVLATTSMQHLPDGLWHQQEKVAGMPFGLVRVDFVVTGPRGEARCWTEFRSWDHDNYVLDPGPFGFQPREAGKFSRTYTEKSNLPQVGQVPFDEGNWPDAVSGFLWGLETVGHGPDIRVVSIMNGGNPMANPSLKELSYEMKFDGIEAGNGRCYVSQIGEHGPISVVKCPPANGNPVTGYDRWGTGGQTWADLGKQGGDVNSLYGDGWWLTLRLAQMGAVTINEELATWFANQPPYQYDGHTVLHFSALQDEFGRGPRVSDIIVGLKGLEWQGPILPAQLPAGFVPATHK